MRFLCTLRFAPQHSVPVGGQPCPGGVCTHWAATRTSMSTSSSLLPDLAWRTLGSSHSESRAFKRARVGGWWAHESVTGKLKFSSRRKVRWGDTPGTNQEDHVSGRPDLSHGASAVRRRIGYLGHSSRPMTVRAPRDWLRASVGPKEPKEVARPVRVLGGRADLILRRLEDAHGRLLYSARPSRWLSKSLVAS